ncbi:putative UDP-N-acetylglucosamine--peptide N-acetylglucosaminyltransferase SPINDLY [Dirofilaria immitis]
MFILLNIWSSLLISAQLRVSKSVLYVWEDEPVCFHSFFFPTLCVHLFCILQSRNFFARQVQMSNNVLVKYQSYNIVTGVLR